MVALLRAAGDGASAWGARAQDAVALDVVALDVVALEVVALDVVALVGRSAVTARVGGRADLGEVTVGFAGVAAVVRRR